MYIGMYVERCWEGYSIGYFSGLSEVELVVIYAHVYTRVEYRYAQCLGYGAILVIVVDTSFATLGLVIGACTRVQR